MDEKPSKNQRSARRLPQQARAQHKVGLILEATQRLLEQRDIAALTTNAIAETAGISIGTLYQYFGDKEAILQALIERELGGLSARVVKGLQDPPPQVSGARVAQLVRAVLDTYGGRRRVHRMLMEHALSVGRAGRLNPLYAQLVEIFAAQGVVGAGHKAARLSPTDAFVLTHAVAGVLRACVATDRPPPREPLEEALTRLVLRFVASGAAP